MFSKQLSYITSMIIGSDSEQQSDIVLAQLSQAVLRIRIHRIHIFLGLRDPDRLVRGLDPDPDPSIIMQK